MYAVMTLSELNLTLAIFRSAELGFFGFMTVTLRHTPFMHGRFPSDSAGDTGFRARWDLRQPLRTWLKVAIVRVGIAGSRREIGAGAKTALIVAEAT
jgi:hypothetical protein